MNGITLSYRRYALALAGLVALVYLAFGGLAYQQYGEAKRLLAENEAAAAHAELRTLLQRVRWDLAEGVQALAGWEELYQQLARPAYFTYWYTHRIREDGREIAPRFRDLMLYDRQGKALAQIDGSRLPRRLDPARLPQRFLPAGQDVVVELFHELPSRHGGPSGFVGVRASLLNNIARLHALARIDPESLHFALAQPTDSLEKVLEAARYRLRESGSFQVVDTLVLKLILLLGLSVLLPTLLLVAFFTRVVGRSVQHMPAVVERLRAADDGRSRPPEPQRLLRVSELEDAEQSLLDYHRELSRANRALDEKNRELWDLAHRDALTGAGNRRAFENFWQTLRSLSERDRRSLRLMLCDVNHFKAINDTYGHDVGDGVLRAIVECLQKAMRRGEQLFRLGGDEFVSVLLDCDDGQALAVAGRCAREVAAWPFRERLGIQEPVRLSIGLSPATDDPKIPLNRLLRQADVAMYHSKRPASGAVTIYRESLESATGTIFSSSVNEAVYRAIERGEGLHMLYQPVRTLADDRVAYHEALLRIRHGDELLTPAEIMPVVESRRLERELDQAVLDELLRGLYAGVIPAGTGLSMNLSAGSISDEGLVARMDAFRPFLPNLKLVLEVTETTLITRMEEARNNILRLRNLGFQVALDDFGSGYSSLRYLTGMPVDIVKFDISLIRALDQDAQFRLVGHLVGYIRDNGLDTVAEGVEDEATLARVRRMGFTQVQGFLVGRPQVLRPGGAGALSVIPG